MRRAIILLSLAVAACSPQAAEKGGAATTGPVAAVARGVVDTETGLVRIRAPRDGVIAQLLVQEGDHVAAGQALAAIDARQAALALDAASAELAGRRAQIEAAAAHADGAARDAARLSRLAAQDAVPRQDAEQAATAASVARGEQRQAAEGLHLAEAKRRLDAYEVEVRTIRAPVAGKIARRDAVAGAFATAAGPLFLLEPDGRRVIRAELDEAFANRVKPGAAAIVTSEFQTGRSYKAHVLRIADLLTTASIEEDTTAKADSRVVSVLLTLDDATDLRIGQRVLVRFTP